MNFSRKILNQTGDGHYNPSAGVAFHQDKIYSLFLDIAKFKYPAYWVDTEVLYESMKPVDPDSGRSRGYIMMSANLKTCKEASLVSDDLTSQNGLKAYIPKFQEDLIGYLGLCPKKGEKHLLDHDLVFKVLTSLGKDFNYLFVYYLYDLSLRIEHRKGKEMSSDLKELEQSTIGSLIKETIAQNKQVVKLHDIFWMINDYQPEHFSSILALVLLATEKMYSPTGMIDMSPLNHLRGGLSQNQIDELASLEKVIGI